MTARVKLGNEVTNVVTAYLASGAIRLIIAAVIALHTWQCNPSGLTRPHDPTLQHRGVGMPSRLQETKHRKRLGSS